MPKESHPAVAMTYEGRYPHKHNFVSARGHNREKNVWYNAFRCPSCGKTTSRLQNPNRGKPNPTCKGD